MPEHSMVPVEAQTRSLTASGDSSVSAQCLLSFAATCCASAHPCVAYAGIDSLPLPTEPPLSCSMDHRRRLQSLLEASWEQATESKLTVHQDLHTAHASTPDCIGQSNTVSMDQ